MKLDIYKNEYNLYLDARNLLYEKYSEDKVPQIIAIYLTGSRYTGLQNDNSDYDFYVVYMPSKYQLYKGKNESFSKTIETCRQEDGKSVNLEFKFIDTRTYIQMIQKSDIHGLEMLWAFEDQVLFAKPEDLSLRALKLQRQLAYKLWNNYKARLLNPKNFKKSMEGMIRSYWKDAYKLFNNGDYEKCLKYVANGERLTNILRRYGKNPYVIFMYDKLAYSEKNIDISTLCEDKRNNDISNLEEHMERFQCDIEDLNSDNSLKDFYLLMDYNFLDKKWKKNIKSHRRKLEDPFINILLEGYNI